VFVPGVAGRGAPGVVVTTGAVGREGDVDGVCADAAVASSPLVRTIVRNFMGKNLLIEKRNKSKRRSSGTYDR